MRAAGIVSILLLFALSFSGCGGEKKNGGDSAPGEGPVKTIRIGFPGSSSNTPGDLLGIAKFSGILDEELAKAGARAEFFGFGGAGPAVNEALIGQSIDLATYNDFPALLLKSRGGDTVVVAVNNRALPGRILVKTDSPIRSLRDLAGKKVGYMRGTGYQKQLWFAVESAGLGVGGIEAINFNSIAEMEAALISGDVDSITHTAMTTRMIEQSRIISDTLDTPGWGGPWISVARGGYLRENREVVVAYVRALIKAREYAVSHKREVVDYFTGIGNDPGQSELIYTNPDTFPVEINPIAVDSIGSSKDFLLSQGFLTADVDIPAWIDRSVFENASQF